MVSSSMDRNIRKIMFEEEIEMRFFTKVLFALVCSFALVVSLTGCDLFGGDDDGDSGGSTASTATVNGTILETDGITKVFSAVTVTDLNDPTRTTTTTNGTFSLAASIDANARVRLKLTATDYAGGYLIESELSAGTVITSNITMKKIIAANKTPIPTAGGTATDGSRAANSATVEFALNSILNANNTPVAATVVVTNAVPKDSSYTNIFPGLYLGTRANGSTTPFESFGFVDVDLGAGNHLDPAKPATISFPIDVADDPGAGVMTIPIWYLATDTGLWVEAGNATRATVGGKTFYQAQVTHFTIYNLDKPFTGTRFTVNVASGSARVANAKVTVKLNNNGDVSGGEAPVTAGAWKDIKYTDTNGQAVFMIPYRGYLNIIAEKDGTTSSPYFYDDTGSTTIDLGWRFVHEPFQPISKR